MSNGKMGLKQAILQRVQGKDENDNTPTTTDDKKITDFSIKRILSESPPLKSDILDLSKNAVANPLAGYYLPPYATMYNSDGIVKPKACNAANCGDCDVYYRNLNLNLNYTKYPPTLYKDPNLWFGAEFLQKYIVRSSIVMQQSTLSSAAYLGGGQMRPDAKEDDCSFKCQICDKVFGCASTLQTHEKTHKSPRYECLDCGKGFSQLRNYKYHLSVHRGTKEFAAKCPECGKTFNDKGYLSSHMKIHRNKKEYECPYCPKSFNQRVAFNMHVRIHTGVKPHKCTECGKRFSRKMLLKQHMRTHSGEKPYQCSVCGKSFADRSNMTLHHRLHSGIKPFNCPICPKAFTKKHHLKTHLNYHTGCKPYVCPHPNCNQAFTQSSNMRTHAKKCQFRPISSYTSTMGMASGNGSQMFHSQIIH